MLCVPRVNMFGGAVSRTLAILITCAAGSIAMSAPITFIFEGQVSGSFDSVDFPLTPFRIVAHADTDNRVGDFEMRLRHDDPARLSLDGFGEYNIKTPTLTLLHRTASGTGFVTFSTDTAPDIIAWFGPSGFPLGNWDMTTSFGPFTRNSTEWSHIPIPTSGGILLPTTAVPVPGTFTAIVVPEPATASLLVFVALAAAGVLRRRR